ncbi:hypothetical protein APB26_32145 [Pseudomonas aeruginosa]|uniref:hypothetical protein n=1 Tax=Pseudomonas aeruginosa TaxID=287 RepID=UPI00071B91C4|nr:hypothetical protein [Pseudomonas aeruginosa]KSQ21637.1 hypothetical protein APB26_32145 [Pseudomonas aeruginosa]RPV61307.1 hypothetical protein IPC838_18480 [Pseudomonas aeruginosa]
MNNSKSLYVGMPIISINGEMGDTHINEEIQTGPFAVGFISAIHLDWSPESMVSAVFEGGVCASLSIDEILDDTQYIRDVSMPPGCTHTATANWAKNEDDEVEQYRFEARSAFEVESNKLIRIPADTPVVQSGKGRVVKGHAFVSAGTADRMAAIRDAVPAGLSSNIDWSVSAAENGLGPDGSKGDWVELDIFVRDELVQ